MNGRVARWVLPIPLAAAAAIADEPAPRLDPPDQVVGRLTSAYAPAKLIPAADKRNLVAEIWGSPFGPAVPGFHHNLRGWMNPEEWIERHPLRSLFRFVAPDGLNTRAPYVVRVFFDGADLDALTQRCAEVPENVDMPQLREASAPVRVGMVFCEGKRALAVSHGEAVAAGPDDESFRRLVADTTRELFPDSRLLERSRPGPFNVR